MEYSALVRVYEDLERTSKRLEKTKIVSEFLKTIPDGLSEIVLLVQGRVFPQWDARELGMASKLVVKAILRATGCDGGQLARVWRETGDLGETAERLTKSKTQVALFTSALTVNKVFANVRKLASLEGAGTVDRKLQLVAELLTSAKPEEAKYVIRTIIGALRVGLGEGTMRDAIAWAFFSREATVSFEGDVVVEDREAYNRVIDAVQGAFDIANDFGEVAAIAKKEGLAGLKNIPLRPGKPLNVMKYQKATSVENAFERVGMPAAFEYKYDGFLMQVHKVKDEVLLFTRRLENVTKQFPDVVELIKGNVKADSCICDAEVVGIDRQSEKFLPFQQISQRIRRKYDIESMARRFPVQVNVFDMIFLDGKSLLGEPFRARREQVESRVATTPGIRPAEQLVTDSTEDAAKFYERALAKGNEGVMAKKVEGTYKPGSRVGYGVKVKPTMDTLDVVITGAEWGAGKRGQWLASFVVGVRDGDDIVEIGRVGTGIKEKDEEGVSFANMTELLEPLITQKDGRVVKVRPEIVIEVDYEEIQTSPTYSSGFALRFPRFVNLRVDRSAEDVSSLEEVRKLALAQRGRVKV